VLAIINAPFTLLIAQPFAVLSFKNSCGAVEDENCAESKLDVPSAPPLAAVNEPFNNTSVDEELTYTENPLSTRKNLPVANTMNGGGLMKKLKSINKKYNLK
jgi:hypothetical protein